MTKIKIANKDVRLAQVNPIFVIRIYKMFTASWLDAQMLTKKQWIDLNEKLIDEIGKRTWLGLLLEALEGESFKTKK